MIDLRPPDAPLDTLRPLAERDGHLERATVALRELGAGPGDLVAGFFVPGRIEVLGKHTDYAGGRSLTCATEQGLRVLVRRRGDRTLRVLDADRRRLARFALDDELSPRAGWEDYPRTVAARLRSNFDLRRGADVVVTSDLPVAAGMSSSSALVVGLFLGLATVAELAAHPRFRQAVEDDLELAGYLGCLENGARFDGRSGCVLSGEPGVGTFGGSEDHTAILCSRPRELGLYRYAPVRRLGRLPLPESIVFVVAVSGLVAEKAAGALADYNRAATLARQAAEVWSRVTSTETAHLGAIAERGSAATTALAELLAEHASPEVRRRATHFLRESEEILPAAFAALEEDDLDAFGRHVDRSQRGAEELLGNQVPETVELQRSARRLGARAASAFGAGFGGSVWALVERSAADAFVERWRSAYEERFPRRDGRFLLTRPAGGASRLG